jgi:hypothetical protein
MVVKSVTERVRIGCSSLLTRLHSPDKNWGATSAALKFGAGQCLTNFIVFGAIQADSGLAVHVEHFSDLGSRYESTSLKIVGPRRHGPAGFQ